MKDLWSRTTSKIPRKLTLRQIQEIRELYFKRGLTYQELSRRYGVVTRTIGAYVTEKHGPQIGRRGLRGEDRKQ